MREIKFRAWDVAFKRMKVTGMGINGGVLSGDDVEIMQYTGLKDKNGTEIYEGDIVRNYFLEYQYKNRPRKNPFLRFEVVFKDGSFQFHADDPIRNGYHNRVSHKYNPAEMIKPMNWEVIGNIYENPELLESVTDPSIKNEG